LPKTAMVPRHRLEWMVWLQVGEQRWTSLLTDGFLPGSADSVSNRLCSRTGVADRFRQGNGDGEAELLLGFADIGNVAIAGGAGVRLAENVHRLLWSENIAHQMGKVSDADHFIRAHVVGLSRPAALQQGEEPVGQVALVEVGAQGCAVTGNGDGFGREGITDEVADGEVHVERQVGAHEGKAAGHNGFEAMLVGKEGAEVFGSALALAIGRARVGQGRAAWPVFGDGGEIGGLENPGRPPTPPRLSITQDCRWSARNPSPFGEYDPFQLTSASITRSIELRQLACEELLPRSI
jgi:hypothetical protein